MSSKHNAAGGVIIVVLPLVLMSTLGHIPFNLLTSSGRAEKAAEQSRPLASWPLYILAIIAAASPMPPPAGRDLLSLAIATGLAAAGGAFRRRQARQS